MKTRKSSGNVFTDLGFNHEEAENLRVRAMLMAAAEKYIRQEEMTQAEAALKLGVSQPRISDLMRGKIDVFSVDTLIAMLARAGLKVKIKITKTKAA
ncbi:MAG: XRE family transcriptional regulator [Armatimonadetes bacterium]|nr:XRE family transcriptional regulator [Armatimonadota bacterium]